MLKVKSNKQYHRKTSRSYIKIHGSRPLDPGTHTFLHWIKTSGVKVRTALKNHIYFKNYGTWKSEIAKIIISCENNYNPLAVSPSAPL